MEKAVKKAVNKRMIAVTVLLLSLMQMAPTGLSPMMSGVSEAFPDASVQSVQFLMTMSGVFVLVLSLVSARLSRRFSKKLLIGMGCVCMMAAGILPVLFHGSLGILRIWSSLLGIGMGLLCALAISLLTDYFEGTEKADLMGIQSGANSFGAMIMSLVGGLLASVAWYLNYLVLLLIVPGFICCLLFVPGKNGLRETAEKGGMAEQEKGQYLAGREGKSAEQKKWISGTLMACVFTGMLFLFCFNAVPTNLSMLISESALGNAATAGVASAVSLFGGVLAGMIFGKLDRRMHLYTIPFGFLCLCAGLVLMAMGRSLPFLMAGCFISGSSITFVMPQCMMQVTGDVDQTQAAFGTAMMMASGNLGTFLTPFLSAAAFRITGDSAVINRYYVCIGITLFLAAIYTIAVTAVKGQADSLKKRR